MGFQIYPYYDRFASEIRVKEQLGAFQLDQESTRTRTHDQVKS